MQPSTKAYRKIVFIHCFRRGWIV